MSELLPFSDVQTNQILLIAGYFKREPKKKAGNVTAEYSKILQRKARKYIDEWLMKGVPPVTFDKLARSAPWIFEKFELTKSVVQENISTQPCQSTSKPTPVPGNTTTLNGYHTSQDTYGQEGGTSHIAELLFSEDDDDDGDDTSHEFEGMPANFLCGGEYLEKTLTLKKILQHFAVSTNQKKSHVTYLLKLLIEYQPLPAYDSLPATGQQLLYIDGRDVVNQRSAQTLTSSQTPSSTEQPTRKKKRKPMPLPPVINLDDEGNCLYVHFGLENALCGDSVGIYFKHADILQYAGIYRTNPEALPFCLRNKIYKMDKKVEVEQAKAFLQGRRLDDTDNAVLISRHVTHFEVDLSADGVQFFDNSEQSECIPICMIVHSVSESTDLSKCKRILLKVRKPVIIGVAHCKTKPDVKKFLAPLIQELVRLDPTNLDDQVTAGRQFTVSIRCIIADWPMRSYLKRIKGHSGYWSCERCIQEGVRCIHHPTVPLKSGEEPKTSIQFLELNAPPRTDEDFLSYCESDESRDNHITNVNDISPFVELNVPMVTAFPIEPMHTMYACCFGRLLKGIVSVQKEGKISKNLLSLIDSRLRLFKKCKPFEFDRYLRSLKNCVNKYKHHELRDLLMYFLFPVFSGILSEKQFNNLMLLQYAMLLMGGFSPNPVPKEDALRASCVLKFFVQQLIDFGYPIRPTTHAVIHLPEDVIHFDCGIESLSAFPYENFYRFFRNILSSGNKPLEQIRNRLVERSKYLLPTSSDGMIINSSQQLLLGKEQEMNSSNKVVLSFKNGKGPDKEKKITFRDFVLSNKFPNNVALMKNGNVVVCSDIIENPPESKVLLIIGSKFSLKEDAFHYPYPSSTYGTHIVSKLENRIGEWNLNCLQGKMYALPHKLSDYNDLPDIRTSTCKWFVTPIRHTLPM